MDTGQSWHVSRNDGKLHWITEPPKYRAVASDPFLLQGQLMALVVEQRDQEQYDLVLQQYDFESGEILSAQTLIALRRDWNKRLCCEVLPLDDSFVAILGGGVICAEVNGVVRWLRTDPIPPTDRDPNWVEQFKQRPLLLDGTLVLHQPGIRAIDRISSTTGRLIWRTVLPGLRQILGASDGRLFVQTVDSVVALDLRDGERQWTTEINMQLTGSIVGTKTDCGQSVAGGFATNSFEVSQT